LAAVPEKLESDKSGIDTPSRREKLKQDGITDPEMPPCDSLHIIDYLYEMGPTVGGAPVTHSEIESWQHNTGVELDAWQARTLRNLSAEYLVTAHNAKKWDCPPPWKAAIEAKPVLKAKTESMRNAIRGLAKL
jgi:hypothetical protein